MEAIEGGVVRKQMFLNALLILVENNSLRGRSKKNTNVFGFSVKFYIDTYFQLFLRGPLVGYRNLGHFWD